MQLSPKRSQLTRSEKSGNRFRYPGSEGYCLRSFEPGLGVRLGAVLCLLPVNCGGGSIRLSNQVGSGSVPQKSHPIGFEAFKLKMDLLDWISEPGIFQNPLSVRVQTFASGFFFTSRTTKGVRSRQYEGQCAENRQSPA